MGSNNFRKLCPFHFWHFQSVSDRFGTPFVEKNRPRSRYVQAGRLCTSNNVQFNQAPGPVPDNADRIQRVEPPQIRRTSESAVRDLSFAVSQSADEEMELDLMNNMAALENQSKRLTERLETKLTAIIAKLYNFDDPDEGDAQMKQLREYRVRDMGLDIIASIGNPQDPVPRRRKRPVAQIVATTEVSLEESAMSKRLKTQKTPEPREQQVVRQIVRSIGV